MVRPEGLEPPRREALEPKSSASTNSATSALLACYGIVISGSMGRPHSQQDKAKNLGKTPDSRAHPYVENFAPRPRPHHFATAPMCDSMKIRGFARLSGV
jgi:hypothetical protein